MAMDRMSGWLALREDGRTPNRRPHRVAARAQQVGPQRLAIGIQRSAVLDDEMLVGIFGQVEAQITLPLPCRLAPHDPEQRLKLLIHRLDGFRRFLEIKSMHEAVRTRYGNTMCRRPPTGPTCRLIISTAGCRVPNHSRAPRRLRVPQTSTAISRFLATTRNRESGSTALQVQKPGLKRSRCGAGEVENSSGRTKPAPGWKLLICWRYPVPPLGTMTLFLEYDR